jgi:hypothetical protein
LKNQRQNTLRRIETSEVSTGRGLNQETILAMLGLGILDGVHIMLLWFCHTQNFLFWVVHEKY